jgi:hypothetical protein
MQDSTSNVKEDFLVLGLFYVGHVRLQILSDSLLAKVLQTLRIMY